MAERKVNSKASGTSKARKAAGSTSKGKGKSTGTKRSGSTKNKASNAPVKLTKEQQAKQERIEKNRRRVNHLIMAVILLALSGFLFISMYTQVAGIVGNAISFLVLGLFGYTGYILPIYFIIYSILLIINKGSKKGRSGTILFTIGFFVLISATYSIGHLGDMSSIQFGWDWLKDCFFNGTEGRDGGFIGMLTAFIITKIIGKGGAYIAVIACMLIAILITMNKPFAWIYNLIARLVRGAKENRKDKADRTEERGRRRIRKQEQLEYDFDDDDRYGVKYDPEEYADQEETEKAAPENDRSRKRRILGLLNVDEDEMFKGRGRKAAVDYRDKGGEETEGFDSAFTNEAGKNLYDAWMSADNKERFFQENSDAFMPDDKEKEPVPQDDYENDAEDDIEEEKKEPAKRAPSRKPVMDSKDLEAGIAGLGTEIAANAAGNSGKQSGNGAKDKPKVTYKMPPISLLKTSSKSVKGNEAQELSQKAMLLENTLKSFNVNAKVVNVSRGPAVTRFEIQPATGVKVSSIVRLQDDIALNLEARSLRMEAPIPGKAAVGIEIENNEKQSVLLRDVVDSKEFKASPSKITFAVGRDISGNSIIADLQKMPHLLIAGSTGSGKSVCINSIVMSLLYKAQPDEVKMIMVDPKVVELSNYNGIPHLLIPVVTEASKAAVALNWAVKEMEERYQKFYDVGVRKLESYNKKAETDESIEKIPQIVIIIDELADLMMAAPQQVEDAICRLAQKARAAGMHLIVATQRPSVDVITGLIKANVPSRMAFAVSSQIDSRTILDSAGAEKLVGNGDMLFNPVGMGKPVRVQGTFVSDEEVQAVIDFVSNQGHEQEFSNDLMDTMESNKMTFDEDEADELLKDAIEHVVEVGHASSSMLQRRFRIGYNRAARLIDMMEERGIVGPQDGSRQRQVFLTREDLEDMDRAVKNIPEMNQKDNTDEGDYNHPENMTASDSPSDAESEE